MNAVTAEIIEMGDVRYESIDDGEVRRLERGVIVQFANVEEFKRAITGIAPVRFEWSVTKVSPR